MPVLFHDLFTNGIVYFDLGMDLRSLPQELLPYVPLFGRALTQIGTVGSRGPQPGQMDIVHHMAADSKGNLYVAEIVTNRRAQKLVVQ